MPSSSDNEGVGLDDQQIQSKPPGTQRVPAEEPHFGRPGSVPPIETPPGMDPEGLASASRSCLAILVLLAVIVLLIVGTTIIRVFF